MNLSKMFRGMFGPSRKPTMTRPPRPRDAGEIVLGTVGYEDGQNHYDLEDEGVPLVKVTLFAGRNPDTEGENDTPTRARGRKILAVFDGRASDIPNDGEVVMLARPAGFEDGPGAFHIISRLAKDPKWIPNRTSGEKVIFGPNDSFLRFKEDGTIFLFCKDGEGDSARPIYVKVAANGFEVKHPHGRMRCDTNGFSMEHSSGAMVTGGAIGGLLPPLDVMSSFVALKAAIVRVDAVTTTIGPDAGQDNLMKAIPSLAAFTALQASVSAVLGLVELVMADLATATIPTTTATAAKTGVDSTVTASGTAVTAAGTAAPTQSLAGA